MIHRLQDVLICPKTKNKLIIENGSSCVRVENSQLSYTFRQGILDFLPGVEDFISSSYDSAASFYSDYITLSSRRWELISQFVWGFSENDQSIENVLSYIPDDFDGLLLDVPVGTGILTFQKYRKLNKAKIIVLDYSLGMLRKARQIYEDNGIENVLFIHGDAGNLPVRDAVVDMCLSMNGFHAFLHKTRALGEISRAVKPGGRFAGCFYIRGERKLTDLIVRYVLSRKGTFTPPFYNQQESLAYLREQFEIRSKANQKSIFYFDARKKEARSSCC